MRRKLSATSLNLFLRSPKAYYWRYIADLEPLQQSVATFDHDKIAGVLWAEFVDRFYKGASEEGNTQALMASWLEQTDGWVPEKARERLTKALESWATTYYQMFSHDDGTRHSSELFLENDRFVAYLDGLSHDGIVHEVKTTSRSPQLMGQLWKVQNSIQVKLYCVLAKAKGVVIEFAFKDSPFAIFRAPMLEVSEEQLKCWEQSVNSLADYIDSLGTDPCNYACHSDGCCLVTKGITSMCQYHTLCDMGLDEVTSIAYKNRKSRR